MRPLSYAELDKKYLGVPHGVSIPTEYRGSTGSTGHADQKRNCGCPHRWIDHENGTCTIGDCKCTKAKRNKGGNRNQKETPYFPFRIGQRDPKIMGRVPPLVRFGQ